MIYCNVNFLYICRNGENEELRYSIRSVMHFFPDAKIYIFGGKPDWYSGPYIEIPDIGNKFDNINNCYKAICNTDIEDFILMNDDFYIINKPDQIINYHDGLLEDKAKKHADIFGLTKYARVLLDANKKLKKQGIQNPLNYDIHTPMLLNKEKLSKIIDLSFAPRSMYGNMFVKDSSPMSDVKVYKNTEYINNTGYFISSEDNSLKKIIVFLKEKFPNPSIYELF